MREGVVFTVIGGVCCAALLTFAVMALLCQEGAWQRLGPVGMLIGVAAMACAVIGPPLLGTGLGILTHRAEREEAEDES